MTKYEERAIKIVARTMEVDADNLRNYIREHEVETQAQLTARIAVRECAARLEAEELLQSCIHARTRTVSPHDCHAALGVPVLKAMKFLERSKERYDN